MMNIDALLTPAAAPAAIPGPPTAGTEPAPAFDLGAMLEKLTPAKPVVAAAAPQITAAAQTPAAENSPAENLLSLLAALTPPPAATAATEIAEETPAETEATADGALPALGLLLTPTPVPQKALPAEATKPNAAANAITLDTHSVKDAASMLLALSPHNSADGAVTDTAIAPAVTDSAIKTTVESSAPVTSFKLDAVTTLLIAPPAATGAAQPTISIASTADPPPPMIPGQDTGEALSEQVIWHLHQGKQEARIQLNPAELGSVDVRLQLQDDKAQLSFVVDQPQARAAVQAALPQLSQMFASQGIQLADAQVQSQQRGHSQPQAQQLPSSKESGIAEETISAPRVRERVGLVDHYA